jgi:hypothetical protein
LTGVVLLAGPVPYGAVVSLIVVLHEPLSRLPDGVPGLLSRLVPPAM